MHMAALAVTEMCKMCTCSLQLLTEGLKPHGGMPLLKCAPSTRKIQVSDRNSVFNNSDRGHKKPDRDIPKNKIAFKM